MWLGMDNAWIFVGSGKLGRVNWGKVHFGYVTQKLHYTLGLEVIISSRPPVWVVQRKVVENLRIILMPNKTLKRKGGYITPRTPRKVRSLPKLSKSGSSWNSTDTLVNRLFSKPKSKLKFATSRTTSRTKLRKQIKNINEGDSGVKKTYVKWILNKTPTYKLGKSYPKWCTQEYANTFSFASSTGTVPGTNQLNRQRVFDFTGGYWKGVDLKVSFAVPYTQQTVYAPFDPQLNSTTLSGQGIVGSVKGALEFSNCEQSNLLMTIYVCVAKKNMETYTSPATAWEAGLDEMAGTVRGAANVNTHMPDSKPTGTYFTERWKIVKEAKIELAAGLTQRFSFSMILNKTLDLSKIYSFNVLKDVTFSIMGVMRGTPVDFDATQTHGPATLIGYAPSKIVGITTEKYTFKTCPNDPPKIAYQLNNISGTAPTAVWELNDEDGKPSNIFAATNVA
jgi:hypothetical protein